MVIGSAPLFWGADRVTRYVDINCPTVGHLLSRFVPPCPTVPLSHCPTWDRDKSHQLYEYQLIEPVTAVPPWDTCCPALSRLVPLSHCPTVLRGTGTNHTNCMNINTLSLLQLSHGGTPAVPLCPALSHCPIVPLSCVGQGQIIATV